MIKNINLEFYQFILLIIMIFFTVYVWIKSIINCKKDHNKNCNDYCNDYCKDYCKDTINENIKLKQYILYMQKYISNLNNKKLLKNHRVSHRQNNYIDNIVY